MENAEQVAIREKAIHAQECGGAVAGCALMMPGRLLVRPMNLIEKTKGNLYLPAHNAKGDTKALNIDRLTMAEVVECSSVFLDTKGVVLGALPEVWPLPKGTVVEFTRMRPWESVVEGLWIINSGDITRAWVGGVPEFFERFEEEK